MNCRDCLHYEACRDVYDDLAYKNKTYDFEFDEEDYARIGCSNFTARSEWLHLPCKVGSHIFVIRKGNIMEMKVASITKSDFEMLKQFYDIDGNILISAISDDCYDCTADYFGINEFGKTVFSSREEAGKALEGMK